jgi:DNA polymerase III delta subunit
MIYSIIGTDIHTRKEALNAILKGRNPTAYVRSDNTWELNHLINADDLFGGEVIALVEQVGTNAEGRETLKNAFKEMELSKNIFIIDEPFIETTFVKTLEKYSETLFDAREEKVKGKDAFGLANAILKRDKKEAWLEWMKVRDMDAEPVQGTLWWRVRTLWEGVKEGKKSLYTEAELARMGFNLVEMSHRAHRGEADLREELEKFVLSI